MDDIEIIIQWIPLMDSLDQIDDDEKTYTVIFSEYSINEERIDLLEAEKNAKKQSEKNKIAQKIKSMWRYNHKTNAFIVDGYKKAKEFCDNNYWYFFVEGNLVFKDDNGIIWCINFDEKITRPPRYETVTRLQTWYEFIPNI